ncbi:hypothetical protein GGR57DRAFT_498443 [Xylariaceae sp. FL1272]|nr:hypothetical protein GGR57DRAFT_498443 [Xylariaceae sp. FL1272]
MTANPSRDHLIAGTPYDMGVQVITGQIQAQWGSFGNFMLAARKKIVNGEEILPSDTYLREICKLFTVSKHPIRLLKWLETLPGQHPTTGFI